MDRTENLQRGIAIAPILFVVAILAVLAVAISAASGAFSGDTSTVSAKAQAAAILEYAEQVKMAVDRVRGHGCLDTEISFENPFVSGYTNPNAPSDKSCHVFDVNGGGIVWKTPPSSSQNQADHDAANPTYGGSKVPTGNFGMASICVMGVGTGGRCQAGNCGLSTFPCYYTDGRTSADVVMYLPWVARDVCLAINQISGFKNKVNGDPPGTGGGAGILCMGQITSFLLVYSILRIMETVAFQLIPCTGTRLKSSVRFKVVSTTDLIQAPALGADITFSKFFLPVEGWSGFYWPRLPASSLLGSAEPSFAFCVLRGSRRVLALLGYFPPPPKG